MSVFPRLNFLFQIIPVQIPEKIPNGWQKQINKLIWNGKNPRIQFKVLQKKRGNLAVAGIKLHHQATQLIWILDWIKIPNTRLIKLESSNLDNRLHNYLWTKNTKETDPRQNPHNQTQSI